MAIMYVCISISISIYLYLYNTYLCLNYGKTPRVITKDGNKASAIFKMWEEWG